MAKLNAARLIIKFGIEEAMKNFQSLGATAFVEDTMGKKTMYIKWMIYGARKSILNVDGSYNKYTYKASFDGALRDTGGNANLFFYGNLGIGKSILYAELMGVYRAIYVVEEYLEHHFMDEPYDIQIECEDDYTAIVKPSSPKH